jgi:arginase family enzyme
MSPELCLSVLHGICDERLVGLDLVGVSPHYDKGITAALAAKILFEAICAVGAARIESGKQ